MSSVQLIADTNIISYLFNEKPLGRAYEELIGDRRVGVTGHTLAELHSGATIAKWGERRLQQQAGFLRKFFHVPETEEMAKLCGVLHGEREGVGRRIEWPDAWAAACALWFDVPLVTHDRDHEGIRGLRVLTLHRDWQVGEENFEISNSVGLWIGERQPWRRAASDCELKRPH